MRSEGKFEWLEVMRGLAALWVLFHHAFLSADHFAGDLGSAPLISNGYLGVDFFFVLSGFIIALSSRRLQADQKGLKDYGLARAVRIYVPYLPIGMGLYVAYMLLPHLSEGGRQPGLWTSLTLLPGFLAPALSVAWTLVHELLFYILFSTWFVSRALFSVVMSFWALAILTAETTGASLTGPWRYVLSPLNLYFFLGMGVYWLTIKLQMSKQVSISLLGAAVLLVTWQASQPEPNRVIAGAGFALAVLAFAMPWAGQKTPWRFSLWLGAASYAVYLVHNPLQSVLVRLLVKLEIASTPWMIWFLISVLSLAGGMVYWWFYERPALRWMKSSVMRARSWA